MQAVKATDASAVVYHIVFAVEALCLANKFAPLAKRAGFVGKGDPEQRFETEKG